VVAKINFRNIRLAYIITGITVACIVIQDIVFFVLVHLGVLHRHENNSTIGLGNYLFLLLLLGAVFVPSLNFRKMMNLGGKRADFFKGSAVTHAIMAAAVSLVGMILLYTYDRFAMLLHYGGGSLNVLHAFGWMANGPFVAFLQQFAFLFLVAAFVHTLVAIQDKWYGWITDIAIVAIISVFTPIAPLRAALAWFFNLIIFHRFAWLQIMSCLVLAALIYSLNKPILARKAI
jgi:hypothetical protein